MSEANNSSWPILLKNSLSVHGRFFSIIEMQPKSQENTKYG